MPPGHLKHVEVEEHNVFYSMLQNLHISTNLGHVVLPGLCWSLSPWMITQVTHCHCFTVFTTLEEWIYVCIIVTGHRVIRPGPHLCCGLQVIGISELATS